MVDERSRTLPSWKTSLSRSSTSVSLDESGTPHPGICASVVYVSTAARLSPVIMVTAVEVPSFETSATGDGFVKSLMVYALVGGVEG